MVKLPLYASVLLKSYLSADEGQVILARDVREDAPLLWIHVRPDGEFHPYPLEAFNNIDDFRCFMRYGPKT